MLHNDASRVFSMHLFTAGQTILLLAKKINYANYGSGRMNIHVHCCKRFRIKTDSFSKSVRKKILCQIVHKASVERVKSLDSIFSSQLKYS